MSILVVLCIWRLQVMWLNEAVLRVFYQYEILFFVRCKKIISMASGFGYLDKHVSEKQECLTLHEVFDNRYLLLISQRKRSAKPDAVIESLLQWRQVLESYVACVFSAFGEILCCNCIRCIFCRIKMPCLWGVKCFYLYLFTLLWLTILWGKKESKLMHFVPV